MSIYPIPYTTSNGNWKQHNEHEKPEAAKAFAAFVFVAWAGAALDGIKLPTAFAGGEGDTAVAGGKVVTFLVGVLLALDDMVGW